MNRIFNTVWNDFTLTFVAVGEHVRGRGKRSGGSSTGASDAVVVAGPKQRLRQARPGMLALEARIMFDGAAVHSVVDAVHHVEAPAVQHVVEAAPVAEMQKLAMRASDSAPAEQKVLIVDGRVPDYQRIVDSAGAGVKVVVLDVNQDGMTQIAAALNGMHDIESISIISHGDNGLLLLGNAALFSADLDRYQTQLQEIGAALKPGGDILLYGCDVGQGSSGLAFIDSLSARTGAVVAASTDATGGTAVGGNWDLDIATGTLHSTAAFDTAQLDNYDHLLVTSSVNSVAQLKAAIATGNSDNVDDVITLTGNITFATAADTIAINVTDGHRMTIVGSGFTINANNKAGVLNVASSGVGSSIEIQNLTITNGLLSGIGGNGDASNGGIGKAGGDAPGAGIYNSGTLVISGSTITANKAAGGGGSGGSSSGYGDGGGGGGGYGSGVGGAGGTSHGSINAAAPTAPSGISGGSGGSNKNNGLGGGRGGSTSGGGGGSYGGYASGGAGGTADNDALAIGGGGGGTGYDRTGGRGGNATGAIYNTGTLTITTSSITNNIAAGGGGGGGSTISSGYNGGAGGVAVGGIWNDGGIAALDTATSATLASGNTVGGGAGGSSPAGNTGASGAFNAQKMGTFGIATTTTTISSASAGSANGSYKAGDTLSLNVTFSAAVTVDTSGGTPTLLLETGSTDRSATYVSGSGTGTLTFSYTVQTGDTSSDLDYHDTAVLSLNGSTIRDAGTNDATLTLPTAGGANSIAGQKSLVIDTARPTATIVVADNALAIGETSLVTITFSELVTGFTNADLTIANGSLSAVSSMDGGLTWTATLTPTASVTDAANLITLDNTGVTDATGNTGSGTTDSNNYAIDSARPTASIIVADNALLAGETSLVTITFSETVTGFNNADLTIANGTLTAVSSMDGGITWTATLTPTTSTTDASNLITLDNTGVADAAGNAGSGSTDSNNYAVSTVRPTASIVVADNALAVGEASLVTITFSEAVTGFSNADLSIANGTLTAVSSMDGGVTWTATLTPTASTTDATNLITLVNSGVSNAAGNNGTGTTNSNNYAIDTARPTATLVVADNALAIGETSLVTIAFSELVTGFTNADLTVANGSLSAVSSMDGGLTWTATLTPTASVTDASNLIMLDNTGVTDAAGNAGSGTTDSNNYAIDSVRPTAGIIVADNALLAGETSLVTITFSEAVTGFSNADLTIANGTLTSVSSMDGGITWTATLTPTTSTTDASNLITLDNTGVADAAGNAGSGSTGSNNYVVNTVRPTTTIVVSDNALKAGETALVTITFSEAVTGFTNADLTIANGTLSAVGSMDGGMTYTATLTPTASTIDAANLITLSNTGITNAAGNTGTGTTDSNNYAIDTARPGATIVVADNALAIDETSLVTITFSEAVTGLTNGDLSIAHGTLSTVGSSDGGTTWTATFTPTTGITDASNLITLNNSGVTNAAGNAGSGSTDSNNYVIDGVRPTASIVIADNALAIGETSLVTITFSEAVTGFTNADLSVANGTLSTVSSSDGGLTWTALLTSAARITNASNVITLDRSGVNDSAGNAGSGTTISNNFAIDAAPAITGATYDARSGELVVSGINLQAGDAIAYRNLIVTGEGGRSAALLGSAGITASSATRFAVTLDEADRLAVNVLLNKDGNSAIDGAPFNLGASANWNITAGADADLSGNAIVVSRTNVAPGISGTRTGQAVDDNASLHPFSGIVITDTDPGAQEQVRIALDHADRGRFTVASLAASGFSTSDGGLSYVHVAGSPVVIEAALRALVYQPVSNRIAVGQSETVAFTVSVNDGYGVIADAASSVLIRSVNDAAVIGDTVASVSEDGPTSASGTLTTTDADIGQSGFVAQRASTGTYGQFTLATSGAWSYQLDNAAASVQALNSGTRVSDRFTVVTADGTSKQFVVTISGKDEAVVVVSPPPAPAVVSIAERSTTAIPVATVAPASLVTAIEPAQPVPEPRFAEVRYTEPASVANGFRMVVSSSDASGLRVLNGMPDQNTIDNRIAFSVPVDAFASGSENVTVQLRADRVNGQALPGWLRFDPQTGAFEGTPPADARGELVIKVTARDANGNEAVTTFRLQLNSKPVPGRAGLSEQLRQASLATRRAA